MSWLTKLTPLQSKEHIIGEDKEEGVQTNGGNIKEKAQGTLTKAFKVKEGKRYTQCQRNTS